MVGIELFFVFHQLAFQLVHAQIRRRLKGRAFFRCQERVSRHVEFDFDKFVFTFYLVADFQKNFSIYKAIVILVELVALALDIVFEFVGGGKVDGLNGDSPDSLELGVMALGWACL